jgi:hypothetical protein
MPPVFVHGVATRWSPDYERGVAARDALFRRYLFQTLGWDTDLEPRNVYWGGNAADFRWNHASLPRGDEEAFRGAADKVEDELLAEAAAGETPDCDNPVVRPA